MELLAHTLFLSFLLGFSHISVNDKKIYSVLPSQRKCVAYRCSAVPTPKEVSCLLVVQLACACGVSFTGRKKTLRPKGVQQRQTCSTWAVYCQNTTPSATIQGGATPYKSVVVHERCTTKITRRTKALHQGIKRQFTCGALLGHRVVQIDPRQGNMVEKCSAWGCTASTPHHLNFPKAVHCRGTMPFKVSRDSAIEGRAMWYKKAVHWRCTTRTPRRAKRSKKVQPRHERQ
jgi:hypothetical protein